MQVNVCKMRVQRCRSFATFGVLLLSVWFLVCVFLGVVWFGLVRDFFKRVMVSRAVGVFSVLFASELAIDLVLFIRTGQCVQAMIRPKLH